MMERKHIVVLSGAGISAESGLRTFRDTNGLWENYSIEDVATPRGWRANPQLVLDFYNQRRRDVLKAQPNAAHIGLAELQTDFDVTIVTQNIDDLHERAGSRNVLHLHGEIRKMRSEINEALIYDYDKDIELGQLAGDGTQLRPHIVWFEEPVPMIEEAQTVMQNADIFVCIGTSLAVYPAAGLIYSVPPFAPKFIIDKHIPEVSGFRNLEKIEMPATAGVKILQEKLKELV
jgi:NAD-dependent deacetylase